MADTALTINDDRVSPLSVQEKAATGCNIKFKVLYSDLSATTSASNDTITLTLGATPAKWYIDKCMMNISTAFTGVSNMVWTVGTTTSVAALISSTSVLTAAVLNQAVGVPVLTNTTATASKSLVAIATTGTGGGPALTAGEFTIYMNLVDATQLP